MDNYRRLPGGAPPPESPRVRPVWRHNVEQEFAVIRQITSAQWCCVVAMDTEFPGVLYPLSCHPCQMTPEEHYAVIKANVDALNLVQVGLTLANTSGQLPGEAGVGYVWEFNIRGFHPSRDPHVAESVKLLREQGMEFDALERDGIEPQHFARLMMSSGLLLNGSKIGWVTFHGAFHFAYLVKLLMGGGKLPESMAEFMNAVRGYFGVWVLDVKCVMRHCGGLFGGLEKVSRDLNVVRAVGKGHQAGSDSLVTFQVYKKILQIHFPFGGIWRHAGSLYGLAPY